MECLEKITPSERLSSGTCFLGELKKKKKKQNAEFLSDILTAHEVPNSNEA